jgi:hypothetical protein
MTCGATLSSAKPVANVLRRSCKTQLVTPLSSSSSALVFDQLLKGIGELFEVLPGNINVVGPLLRRQVKIDWQHGGQRGPRVAEAIIVAQYRNG